MTTKYRVAWKTKDEGHTGHGEPLDSEAEAQKWVEYWNEHAPYARYWVEAVEVEAKEERPR